MAAKNKHLKNYKLIHRYFHILKIGKPAMDLNFDIDLQNSNIMIFIKKFPQK